MLRQRLVAHRGYQAKYPENTLVAMKAAVSAGACYVETDIQFTRDLVPVLYHDPFLVRISGSAGNIQELDALAVSTTCASEPFRLGEAFKDEKVAKLSDLVLFLGEHSKVTAFIEAKEEAISFVGIEAAFDRITAVLTDVKAQAVLISFDQSFVAYARKQGYPQVGVVLRSWEQLNSPELSEIAPDYIFANVKLLPPNDNFDWLSSLLVVYEIDDPTLAIELFNRGVDMVETFDIGGMIDSLGSHSL